MHHLAVAPQPSWAGIITAFGTAFTALALVITALGAVAVNRRTSKRLDANQAATTARLNVIHTLVNSTLTAALQAQLDSTRRELTLLAELADVQCDAGRPISADRLTSIGLLRRHITELESAMAERVLQARNADIQIQDELDREAGKT